MFTSSYAVVAVKRNAIFKKQNPTQASICRAFLPLPVSPPSSDRWSGTYKASQHSGANSEALFSPCLPSQKAIPDLESTLSSKFSEILLALKVTPQICCFSENPTPGL